MLSYYSSVVTLNAEGDTSISEETLEGLGRTPRFLSILFGSIIKIVEPPKRIRSLPLESHSPTIIEEVSADVADPDCTMCPGPHAHVESTLDGPAKSAYTRPPQPAVSEAEQQELTEEELSEDVTSSKKSLLTEILPDPGYFAAGGLAGVISRTATAPLDRLKVYLIANTGTTKESIEAVKKGDALSAVKHAGRPLVDATRELWRTGGVRSLFAGKWHARCCRGC